MSVKSCQGRQDSREIGVLEDVLVVQKVHIVLPDPVQQVGRQRGWRGRAAPVERR